MAELHRTLDLEAPPEACFRILTDYPSYPRFLPAFRELEPEQRDDQEAPEGEQSLRAILEIVRSFRLLLVVHERAPHEIRWWLREGNLKELSGRWELIPLEEGRHCRARLHLTVRAGFPVPLEIQENLEQVSLPAALLRLAERVAVSGTSPEAPCASC